MPSSRSSERPGSTPPAMTNTRSVSRFLFYPVRKLIQRWTSKDLDYDYFSQDLLIECQRQHGPLRGLYYDPRGVLYEAHSGKASPLGTREVDAYQFPAWLYDKILYVEKKGVWPILQAAALAERYDMAVIAAEGYATEATRVLFAQADKGQHYQLFVLHDADPDGYNIARTLREETRRMPGYAVEIIDLGSSSRKPWIWTWARKSGHGARRSPRN